MKFNSVIVLVLCLTCWLTPANTTSLLGAKIAAGVKGAALLGSGALAIKGTILKGVGKLLAAKEFAVNNVADAVQKPPVAVTKENSSVVTYEHSIHSMHPVVATIEIRPVKFRTVERPVEIHQIQLQPADVRPVEVHPIEIHQVQTQPADVRPVEVHPIEIHQVQTQPADVRPVEVHPIEIHQVQIRPVPPKFPELVKNRLSRLLTTIHGAVVNKTIAVAEFLQALKCPSTNQSPVSYEIVPAPKYYQMP